MNKIKISFSILAIISLISCSYSPIFAPNYKLKKVGQEKAQQDAQKCKKEAKEYLAASKKRRAAKEGVRGAGVGAIFGAIFGLFTGDVKSVVKSAAIGAGVGGAIRGGSVLAEDKLKPDQIQKRYISKCLSKKGYEILGWE